MGYQVLQPEFIEHADRTESVRDGEPVSLAAVLRQLRERHGFASVVSHGERRVPAGRKRRATSPAVKTSTSRRPTLPPPVAIFAAVAPAPIA